MSKITNYGLTQSGTGCFFIVVSMWASKGQKMYDAFLGVRESLASAAEPAVRYVLHLMSSQL